MDWEDMSTKQPSWQDKQEADRLETLFAYVSKVTLASRQDDWTPCSYSLQLGDPMHDNTSEGVVVIGCKGEDYGVRLLNI